MAGLSSITVNDRESTPVAHVFTPRRALPDARFAESDASGALIGEKSLIVRTRLTEVARNVRLTLSVPIVQTETINGIASPKVLRVTFIDANFRFDKNSTLQERKNAVGMFYNMLAASQTMLDATLTGTEEIF